MATAVSEQSVEETLRGLYELQQLYIKLNEFDTLKGELPIEVSDLEDEIEGLMGRITKLEEDIQGGHDKIAENRNKIKEAQANIEKYDRQLNKVKNNREYDALSKEIELQKLEIELLEKRCVEVEEANQSKEAYHKESLEALQGKKDDLELKKKELEKIISETDKEEKKLRGVAEKSEGQFEERLIKAFHRIRQTYRNGMAVVKYDRDSCGGCFAKIPPQRQLEIRQRKKITTCEHCGRILVDPEVDGAAAE